MSYNTIGYLLYLPITAYITIIVGRSFHKNGIYFILSNQISDQIAHAINNLLLIGYYLVNIGYAFITIIVWNDLTSFNQLIEEISYRTATIILLLAFLHYMNLTAIALWKKYQKQKHISIN